MPWESDIIPGHAEAVASEQKDRSLAFLELPEDIAGVICEPLTPLRLEWLEAGQNPFICGGYITTAVVMQFLWIVNAGFNTLRLCRDDFMEAHLSVNYSQAVKDIESYLDRAFLDSPQGSDSTRYYASSADLIFAMQRDPFRWSYSRVMNSPLRVIYQLLKADARSREIVVINRRSQKIECDWLADQQKKLDASKASNAEYSI